MINKWKIAFWIVVSLFFLTTTFLLYAIIDQSYTITYMKEGYEDTESDLQQLSSVIVGKLTYSDFKEISDRNGDLADSTQLGLNQIRILFDKDGKVKKVTSKW